MQVLFFLWFSSPEFVHNPHTNTHARNVKSFWTKNSKAIYKFVFWKPSQIFTLVETSIYWIPFSIQTAVHWFRSENHWFVCHTVNQFRFHLLNSSVVLSIYFMDALIRFGVRERSGFINYGLISDWTADTMRFNFFVARRTWIVLQQQEKKKSITSIAMYPTLLLSIGQFFLLEYDWHIAVCFFVLFPSEIWKVTLWIVLSFIVAFWVAGGSVSII